MRNRLLTLILLCLGLGPAAWAADDGQTQPRLSYANLNSPGTTADIVPTTNGSGNVKGIHCRFGPSTNLNIHFYVNGGAAQTITVNRTYFMEDSAGNRISGWIPYNVRFSSSIRVQMERGGSPVVYGDTPCAVSWALD